MAKKKSGSAKMLGPLYTSPGKSLGAEEVSGPTSAKTFPDPLGFLHVSKK